MKMDGKKRECRFARPDPMAFFECRFARPDPMAFFGFFSGFFSMAFLEKSEEDLILRTEPFYEKSSGMFEYL